MTMTNAHPEFRIYYFTNVYASTIRFYTDVLGLEAMRSWDRGPLERGTIFRSPNGVGLIEIEEGAEPPTALHLGLYIQVDDVDAWYARLTAKGATTVQALTDTDFGHRSFKIADPNGLVIALFRYL